MRRLLLALLVFGSFALGFRVFVDRTTAPRGSPPRAAEPVPAAPAVEDELTPRASERLPEAGAEEPPAPAPASDGFPRSLLAGHVRYYDGRPAAAVALEVRAQAQRGQPRPLASLRAEDDGSFAAEVLGTGPFRVAASAESGGGVRLAATLEHVPAGMREVELELPYSGRVRGRVLDGRGEPVRAFTLELEPREHEREPAGRSRPVRAQIESEDGAFQSGELASGAWQLVVTAAGYGPSAPRWCAVPDGSPQVIRLARACRLSGVVYGSNGRARAGARVSLSTAREPVFTDASGAFAISGGPGFVHLQATDPASEAGAPLELELVPGAERVGLVLRLGASGSVSGRVVTLGNRPATGRSILFRALETSEPEVRVPPCVTDESGRFAVDIPPGQWEASVALDERELEAMELAGPSEQRPTEARAIERVLVRANETAEVWLALAPAPVRVSGALLKSGRLCQGGEVEVVDHRGPVRYRARVEGSSYALGLGRPGLHEFRVTLGATTQSLWVDVPAQAAHELDLDVPVGWIEGFVRAFDGARVADVKVWAGSPAGSQGGGAGHALTDAEGHFVLELAPGTYDVGAGAEQGGRQPWGRRSVTVERDVRRTGLELVLVRDPTPVLEVVLRGSRGEMVEGGRVSVTVRGWGEPDVRSVEAPLGVATFSSLPTSEVEVAAEAPGYFLAESPRVPIEWGKLRRLELSLQRASEVVVRVRSGGATGPVHGLDAVAPSGLVFEAAPFAPDHLPDEPGFRWSLLPAGEYRVRVFAGAQVLERALRVDPGAVAPAGLEISVP